MAVTTQFGVPVENANATLMPKLQYRFRVSFTGLGGNAANITEVTQNVISIGRPSITHEEVIVDSYNSKTYLAGKHTWEPVSLVMRDDMNSNVIKKIGNQLREQLDHSTQGGQAIKATASAAGTGTDAGGGNPYKFTMLIETLDGQAKPTVIDSWELVGCYLSNVQYGDLNYGTSDMVQVTATIRYDNASNTLMADTNVETDTLGKATT
jgi:hypothetical protein